MRYLLTALLVASAVVVASAQSGVDGKWAFEMTSPMGSVTAQVELKAEGDKLTGDKIAGVAGAMGTTVEWAMARAK